MLYVILGFDIIVIMGFLLVLKGDDDRTEIEKRLDDEEQLKALRQKTEIKTKGIHGEDLIVMYDKVKK